MNKNERNEMNNRQLKETVANVAISTLAQGEEYENLSYTTLEFGYIFTIEDHGIEALFKVITDKGTYYFAAQKQSIMRIDINEEFFKATTSQFLELRNNVEYEEEAADTARRERSISILEKKGISYIPQLYVIMPESEATLRPPEEIAHRLLAMFGVCVYSEVRGSGKSWDDAQEYLNAVDNILNLDQNLTPEEKLYLAEKSPNQREIAQFGWRYECCHVLMWALGVFDEIGFPNNICDVSRIAKIIWNTDSPESLLKSAKPRNLNEILDQADLMLRYNWACVDARINNRQAPAGLNGGVVHEWQYALQWLIDNSEDWDDVSVST